MTRTVHCKKLSNPGHQKMCTLLKKTQKSLNGNIFVPFGFRNKTKKWNSIFTITSLFFHSLATFAEGSG
jgi:hypothetical protein